MLEAWIERDRMEAGCDEAGRGCLAGPVTAAAVVLQPEFAQQLVQEGHLNDSKKMTKAKREALRIEIEAHALAWAVTHVSPEEIDRINILNASFAAMRRSVRALSVQPDFMLIDGNRFRTAEGLPEYGCYVKGDARFASIAAASVLAKPTGMPTCWSCTQPSRSMGGMPMRAIRRSNTARPSGSTGQHPITVRRSASCPSR